MPRITLLVCAAMALCAAASTTRPDTEQPAPPAAATPTTTPGPHQHFTAALATFGLRFEDHSSAVEVGLATCDALDRNVTPSQIAELLTQSLPITPTEAELLILTAVDELCTDDLTGEK
ncbi:DUF732 domain-containing protein [Rhodococcus koreensis]|uniref:DUF732 domain-containing protein n=1 Tax=Rhodococcus koreensis TaxID=99653 RepID=A0A1H4I7P4_9NOCA|nr:DUF732 domain-containing protein [Rhodococcus koreensis]SEB29993.1 Protein of unknown function [Rhodococcus koreensis]